MAYEVHNFEDGQTLYAKELNEIDEQVKRNETNIPDENDLIKKSASKQSINGDLILTDIESDPSNPSRVQVVKAITALQDKADDLPNYAKTTYVDDSVSEKLKSAKEYADSQDKVILQYAKDYAAGLAQGLKMSIDGTVYSVELYAENGVPAAIFRK